MKSLNHLKHVEHREGHALVIMKNPALRRIHRDYLKLLLYRDTDIVEASSGEQGLIELESDDDISLVIIGWDLPGISVSTVLREMREKKITIPAIVLTPEVKLVFKRMETCYGAIVIVAPVKLEQLRDKVEKLVPFVFT